MTKVLSLCTARVLGYSKDPSMGLEQGVAAMAAQKMGRMDEYVHCVRHATRTDPKPDRDAAEPAAEARADVTVTESAYDAAAAAEDEAAEEARSTDAE
ncbi:hypothetical protein RvY_03334 [Ramazzottius varieornatus]|uniref:Uncharacterized protein n=1 Tax=Ramazzottius varieornatus TaxID=947166 RepID=A0A1D1UMQ2_RAMVA|nr:hypothetical protein RvY_03334 [Ramazzottius varieornatus]